MERVAVRSGDGGLSAVVTDRGDRVPRRRSTPLSQCSPMNAGAMCSPSAAEAVVIDDHDRSCKVDSTLPLA
ncbi:hypothetical protein [Calidifontibacter terrae]